MNGMIMIQLAKLSEFSKINNMTVLKNIAFSYLQ